MRIPYDPLLVSIDADDSSESVLTSKDVLVSDPDDISNSHIPVSYVPLGPGE